MQHNQSTDLIKCLYWKNRYPTVESRRLHALEIIRSGADIHSVTKFNHTCLHLAIQNSFVDVVQLLLEKGIDANAQISGEDTALNLICHGGVQETELIPMLLYHGADPWIRNDCKATPLDYCLAIKFPLVATIEHLYYYMFDQYTESGLSVHALLRAADSDLPIFREIVGTIIKVELDNLEMWTDVDIENILTMPPENLKLLLDKFDYVFIPLFCNAGVSFYNRWSNRFRFENVCILVGSHLQREFIDWLSTWKLHHRFLRTLFKNPASQEEIVYYLLSYGMEIHEGDVETLYKYRGYNELFKFLRFMDVKASPMYQIREPIPRLIFQVTGDIQKSIEDPRFWVKCITKYSKLNFEHVLAYYAVPNLKDLCLEVKVEGNENFFKKLHNQPRVPLLVEMARNVFRKYFVQRLEITSAKQFYESLELLPISVDYRKIIALETELY